MSARSEPGEPGSGDVSPEGRQLMAQHQDLGAPSGAQPVDPHQLDHAANKTVEEAEHRVGASRRSSHQVKPTIEYVDPSVSRRRKVIARL
jgi:hypothetical protein